MTLLLPSTIIISPMFPEPRYLQLEEELFPSITLYKELIFESQELNFHLEFFERVAYDSVNRAIDLTESLQRVLKKICKEEAELEVWICDPLIQDYRLLAYFPIMSSVTLGEQFLQLDVLIFRFKPIHKHEQQPALEFQLSEPAGPEEKGKRRKTIREILQVADQWRKLCVQKNYKISLQQGAQLMGITKRSLMFYLHNIKLGEKLGFKFQANLESKISELVSFVSERWQAKQKEAELLSKLKTYYK